MLQQILKLATGALDFRKFNLQPVQEHVSILSLLQKEDYSRVRVTFTYLGLYKLMSIVLCNRVILMKYFTKSINNVEKYV